MTTIKLYTINCDGGMNAQHAPGCEMWIANADTASEALAEARAAGWVRQRLGGYALDYSPECWRRQP